MASALSALQKKAPVNGAFFLALVLLVWAWPLEARLWGDAPGEWVKVEHVNDGDTFSTVDGDKVRMIGVNTPELHHGKKPDEPLAKQARDWLEDNINNQRVRLVYGKPKKDKYGRLLARVFNEAGEELQLGLLREGLAFAIAVGLDFPHLDDYLAAQDEAISEDRGVWGYKHYAPEVLERGLSTKRGYARIQGEVKRISQSKKYKTLWLTDRFRVMVPHANWRKHWPVWQRFLDGKTVEARGWVFKAQGMTGMKVYHPSMLQVLE